MLEVKGMTEVYSVTGPYDLVVMVRIAEVERLAQIVPETLAQIPGVARTETMVAFRYILITTSTASGYRGLNSNRLFSI